MRASVLGLALLLVLAGCGDGGERDPIEVREGRACQAVDLDTVESVLGVRFDTSASAHVEQTHTCVLSTVDASLPDLTFSMAATAADEVTFTVTVTPSLATPVTELGRIAYQVGVPPGTGADGAPTGPGVEVGWLSAAPRLMLLRYMGSAGTADADVAALAPRLVELARGIEQATLVGPTLG